MGKVDKKKASGAGAGSTTDSVTPLMRNFQFRIRSNCPLLILYYVSLMCRKKLWATYSQESTNNSTYGGKGVILLLFSLSRKGWSNFN